MKKYLVLLLFIASVSPASETDIQTLESLVSKYVDLKTERARTAAEWEADKKILKDEQDLLEREKGFLARELESLETASSCDTQKLEELRSKVSTMESFSSEIIPVIEKAEESLKPLLFSLPGFLKKNIFHETLSLPQSSSASVDRVSKLLKTYQKLQEFHNQVHLSHETLLLNASMPKEYEVLYLGLSRAFFISPDNLEAGFGELIQQKWIWTPQNPMSSVIRKAIHIQKNLSTAEYVSLPLSIKE